MVDAMVMRNGINMAMVAVPYWKLRNNFKWDLKKAFKVDSEFRMWPSNPLKFCDYYSSSYPTKEKFLGTPNHLKSKFDYWCTSKFSITFPL